MPQRMGAGFQAQGELPQSNPEIRPSLTLEECITNEEMELLASYVYGVQTYPGKFHKNDLGDIVAFPPYDRMVLAIQQFEEAGFNFMGIVSKPATMWKIEPFAMVQEGDRDRVPEILNALIKWNTTKLQKYFDDWKEHLEKLEFALGEDWKKAPLTIEEGRSFNIKSLKAMKIGETPADTPTAPKAPAESVIGKLQNAQNKKLKDLNNEKLLAQTGAKASGKKGVAAAVAAINEADGGEAAGEPQGEAPAEVATEGGSTGNELPPAGD